MVATSCKPSSRAHVVWVGNMPKSWWGSHLIIKFWPDLAGLDLGWLYQAVTITRHWESQKNAVRIIIQHRQMQVCEFESRCQQSLSPLRCISRCNCALCEQLEIIVRVLFVWDFYFRNIGLVPIFKKTCGFNSGTSGEAKYSKSYRPKFLKTLS